MSTLQFATAAGCLVGLGVTLILWRLVPAQPHLGAALDRLAPDRTLPATPAAAGSTTADRVGLWAQRRFPLLAAVRIPTRELAVLRIPPHRYLGETALYAALGLLFPPVLTVLLTVGGIHLPLLLPAAGSLALAGLLALIPAYNARDNARKARQEFSRALSAYIDLVALERRAGAGSTQALELAAQVGDSWVFARLREELARARWSGSTPWDGLTQLAEELGLPELADLGSIMRLSGEQGATVYTTLRARSASLRNAMLSEEHARANAAGEKMTLPVALLSLIFLLLLAVPSVLRVLFGAS